MNQSEAFELLGLDPSATEEEIKARYRELAKDYHPDSDGSGSEMSDLTKAKDVAVAGSNSEIDIFQKALERVSGEHQLSTVIERDQQREESRKVIRSISSRHTSRYRRKQQSLLMFGVFLGIILLLFRIVVATPFNFGESPADLLNDWAFISAGTIYLMILAGAYWITNQQIKNFDIMIDEADEVLDDKGEIVGVLSSLGLNYQDDPSFTRQELEARIDRWLQGMDAWEINDDLHEFGEIQPEKFHASFDFKTSSGVKMISPSQMFFPLYIMPPELDFRRLGREIGVADFSRLLLRKGIEQNVVIEEESFEDGVWDIGYTINTPRSD